MGNLDALLEVVERDARAEAELLISAAERQAEAIRSRAEAERARRRAEVIGRLDEAGRRAVACATAAAAHRFRDTQLRQRAGVLEQVFAEAAGELRAAGAERYRAALPGLVRDALRFLEGTPAVITCRPEIAPVVEAERPAQGEVTIRPSAEAAAGILAQSADGAVVVDNTLPALLRRRQAELGVALAARLGAG